MIEEQKMESFTFSEVITILNMKNENLFIPYYLHCMVVYEDITDLMDAARSAYDRKSTRILNNEIETNLICDPLYFPKQENFFYPIIFGFVSRTNCNGVYLEILEKIINVSIHDEKIFEDDYDSNFYKLMKFSTNLLFLLNNLFKPAPNTIIQYKICDFCLIKMNILNR